MAAPEAHPPSRMAGDLPILEHTVIRPQVVRRPRMATRNRVWLWFSGPGADGDVDRPWQAFLRRFDIEHTFIMIKQTLGWTRPRLQEPVAPDRWT